MIWSAPMPNRQRLKFGWAAAVASALTTVLIWALWVLPISRSIESIGSSVVYDVEKGKKVGIWTSGHSSRLGTVSCTVEGPDGGNPSVLNVRSLSWEDTLWWKAPRQGFEQTRWFTATSSVSHSVMCRDSLDTYDGEYLLAKSATVGGQLGVKRIGVTFAKSEILAMSAVFAPQLLILLIPIMTIQTLRVRLDRRKLQRSWPGLGH